MAKIIIQNEEGQYLNRYELVPVEGQPGVYDLVRMANITKQGTPYNEDTMAHYAQLDDIPQKLPNPHPIDFAGAVSGRYDGTAATTITIPTVPTALKNPQVLTITGAASATYDGSAARTVNIPTTAQDTSSIAGALTVSTAAPGSTLATGKLWGRYG